MSKYKFNISLRLPEEQIVKDAYNALLGREPEAKTLKAASAKLAKDGDLVHLLSEICRTPEYILKILSTTPAGIPISPDSGIAEQEAKNRLRRMFHELYSNELTNELYRGVLDRTPDPSGLKAYSNMIVKNASVYTVIKSLLGSDEFRNKFKPSTAHLPCFKSWLQNKNRPAVPALVFLHVQKTAGTAIHAILRQMFDKSEILVGHNVNLKEVCPAMLYDYTVIGGHFEYDQLAAIPNRNLEIFTFFRKPHSRLISLYYFWRAHEPQHFPALVQVAKANAMGIDEMFEDALKTINPATFNHMTWAVMGNGTWGKWKTMITANKMDEGAIESVVRPAMRERLSDFIFIGMQEDFNRSIEMLKSVLGVKDKINVQEVHSLDKLVSEHPNFKKKIEKQTHSANLEKLLDKLTSLDAVLYEEALKIYNEQVRKFESGIPLKKAQSTLRNPSAS